MISTLMQKGNPAVQNLVEKWLPVSIEENLQKPNISWSLQPATKSAPSPTLYKSDWCFSIQHAAKDMLHTTEPFIIWKFMIEAD